ncbi:MULTISPECIES: AMP-binding protein [unclassified Synechococcus]|uniref:AMP-binding protein n=1 Tax=unclassified Synechococcus TaxID=2626047 RepID=UPI001CF82758|nr:MULTISPECIES: AMP-binding protein [unclassified Synechococcus]MCB4376637.1 AMP-binding protein [Synechococcus sp. MU1650]MCB4411202.1 AMP-binding protein [Synechococcus sp. MU1611]
MSEFEQLERGLAAGQWVSLSPEADAAPIDHLPPGPGVLVRSGGSSGGSRCCAQPLDHLDRSAAATAHWIKGMALDPAATLLLNPLPMAHVSGLMPWWRARCWGASHQQLQPGLMKNPTELLACCRSLPAWGTKPVLLSLVPTQLARLLVHPDGVAFLLEMQLIWIGGAALPPALAEQARALMLPLAPCYGSTETAAMVAALPPARFLDGEQGCGDPLVDVELRLAADGALEVRTDRLAHGRWCADQPDRFEQLTDADGWWRSGDRAAFTPGLQIVGRMDGAIHSGGETVFPEQLEQRLMAAVQAASLPVSSVLLLGVDNPEWGQTLVALVGSADDAVLQRLATLTRYWEPPETPRRWVLCPDLAPSALGKWQRQRWREWLQRLDSAHA